MNKKSAIIRVAQMDANDPKKKKKPPAKKKKETPMEAARNAPNGRAGSSLGMGLVGTILKATVGKKKTAKPDGYTGAGKKKTTKKK